MDAQIIINSIDQTGYLVSLSRSYNYCSVSQEFTIDLDLSCPTTINTYDSVIIYEEGVKVLTGVVQSVSKKAPEAKITIHGQDEFAKAADFFVPTTYTTGFGQTAQYWLEFLLDLADLTAIFTDGSGPTIVAEQEIGFDSVASLITPILQYAGFYARVDQNGIVIIGKIDKTVTLPPILQGSNLINISLEQSYDKTRNKAIVFGGVDTTLNRFERISSISEIELGFLPVDQTVVVGNPLIADQESADNFANALVNEFAKPTQIKNVSVLGNPLYQAGKYVEVHSDLFTGIALVTSFQSSFNDQGYTMDMILDDPCPRIVAAIKHQPDLYAGTEGAGVWAYSIYDETWQDISAGLTNLYINDLSVDNGLFIAATPAGIYTKLASDPWVHQTLPLYSGMIANNLLYSGVYANLFDLEVNAIVTSHNPSENYTYFYTGTIASGGSGFRWSGAPIADFGTRVSGLYYAGTDLEGNYGTKHITTIYDPTMNGEKIHFIVSGVHIYEMSKYGQFSSPIIEASGASSATNVTSSFDLSEITFAADFGDGQDIYISDANGQNQQRLTHIGGCRYPSWNRDSTKIVFVSDYTGRSQLYYVDVNTKLVTAITATLTELTRSYPRFISDTVIVFSQVHTINTFINIFSINIDGSGINLLTNNNFNTFTYKYDTTQLKVLYTSSGGAGNQKFYSINTNGSSPTLEYNTGGALSAPNITKDGEFVIFSEGGKIYIAGRRHVSELKLNNGGETSDTGHYVLTFEGQERAFYIRNTVGNPDDFAYVLTDGSNNTGSGTILYTAALTNQMRMIANNDRTWLAILEVSPNFGSAFNFTKLMYSDGEDVFDVDMTGVDTTQSGFTNFPGAINHSGERILLWVRTAVVGPNADTYSLWEISTGGGVFELINGFTFTGNTASRPAYNKDGTHYAFSKTTAPIQVYVDGAAVVNGIFRAWSPVEENVFYYSKDSFTPSKIYKYDLDSLQELLVYTCSSTNAFQTIDFSEESGFMLIAEDPTGVQPFTINAMRLDSDERTTIVNTGSQPTWTTRSGSIVFHKTSDANLYIISPKIILASGTEPYYNSTTFNPTIRLFETFNNQDFYLIYETGDLLLENNFDTYNPTVAYGQDGGVFSNDTFLTSGIIIEGLEIFDVATKELNTNKTMYVTTPNGIYSALTNGSSILKNAIQATEIVSRYYGSGEIFFSIDGTVKQSNDECQTYVDISTGLPGPTITVLRLDK